VIALFLLPPLSITVPNLDIELEKKFADILFYGDLNRIIYASPDFNFRERSRKHNGTLDIPFMSYWLHTMHDETQRSLFNNEANVLGIDLGLSALGIRPKITPLYLEYEAVVFFSQDKDLKYASSLLNKLKSNENIVYYYLQTDTVDSLIKVPAFLSVDTDYNPEFAEEDWLKENNIMSVAMTWSIDTFQLNIHDTSIEEDFPRLSITEQTVFNFLVSKNLTDKEDVLANEGILLEYFNPPPTYTMTYEGNGYTGGYVPEDTMVYEQGDIVTIKGAETMVRQGFTFNGWNTDYLGGGIAYAAGATFNMGTANITLYAQWI
jgi:uncharacterized repeat protein (TIGR02543 family)